MWRPNTPFCRCWNGAADCAGSFAGQCRQIFLFFSVGSLTCFVTRATLSVYLKAHSPAKAAVVLLSHNGLEVVVHGR